MLLTQPWWPTWEGIAAIGQWIGGIGAILAVFYASQQVRVAIKQSEDSRDIALRQMEESRDLSIKQMEDNRKLVMEQIEEQRKIAMQQMEDNRDLVMKQLEEQRHLAEKQMDDNRELVLKQIEEQRNISEEEREPKVSIHTAIQEREIDGEKRRVLIATATNIGSMPIYLTESDSIDKGSISFRLWEALESYKNPKNIGLLNVTRRTKSDYNNNYYTCKTIDESLPKSLVPGDFATVEIDLTSGMEQKLYESYTDEYLNRFIKFDSENQFTKAEALWFRANVTPQLLLTINAIEKSDQEDPQKLYKKISGLVNHATNHYREDLCVPPYIQSHFEKRVQGYLPVRFSSRMTTLEVIFRDSNKTRFYHEIIYISTSLIYSKQLNNVLIYINYRSDDFNKDYYIGPFCEFANGIQENQFGYELKKTIFPKEDLLENHSKINKFFEDIT